MKLYTPLSNKKGTDLVFYETAEMIFIVIVIVMIYFSINNVFSTEKLANQIASEEIPKSALLVDTFRDNTKVNYYYPKKIRIKSSLENDLLHLYFSTGKESRAEHIIMPPFIKEINLEKQADSIEKDSGEVKIT